MVASGISMVSVILDTNSVIAYLNGDPDAAKRIELTPELLLPAIVIGELAYGAPATAATPRSRFHQDIRA